MRVAMYYNNNDVRLEDIPKPNISDGEILIKTIDSGICGTDVLEWYRLKTAPRVLGHEATGEIVEVGKGVKDYKVGDRVFVTHHVPCNTCRYCLSGHHTACETLHKTNYDPGGFSEYIRVPKINVDRGTFLLPEDMSYEDGTFIEPVGCVVRGERLAQVQPGSSVLIIGRGISGLIHLQLVRSFGATRVFAADINEYRMEFAKKFGADAVLNAKENIPELVKKINGNRLADLVIVCTGAVPAVQQAVESVERGGTVLFFAVPQPGIDVPIPLADLWRNEIKLMTSYGAAPGDLAMAIEIIHSGKIKVHEMITHRFGLNDTGVGFKLVASAKESLKVIIEP